MRIGLTGGIGSGKSAVARVWAECGALVIDADESAREAVALGSPGLTQIAARWPQVVTPAGLLDRTALGKIVFMDDVARSELEAIVHPAVRAIALEKEAAAAPNQAIVHMVPLLFEVGYDQRCDMTVVVIAPDEERIARVETRDGLSREAVLDRIRRQIDPLEAARRADVVIANDGDLALLHTRAVDVFRQCTQSTDPLR